VDSRKESRRRRQRPLWSGNFWMPKLPCRATRNPPRHVRAGRRRAKSEAVGCQAGTDMGYLAQVCSGWMLSWFTPFKKESSLSSSMSWLER
jgi:hypothetical protein